MMVNRKKVEMPSLSNSRGKIKGLRVWLYSGEMGAVQ